MAELQPNVQAGALSIRGEGRVAMSMNAMFVQVEHRNETPPW